MQSHNTNKIGIQYICWFYSEVICYDAQSYDRKFPPYVSISWCVATEENFNVSYILQVLNPLDAVCNRQRTDAVCINQLKNAKHIDDGLLQERPDVKIFLPFRFLFYRPEEVFQPHSYNRYLGKLCCLLFIILVIALVITRMFIS